MVITPEGSTPSLVCSWIAYPTPSVTWTMTGGGGVSTGGRYSSPSVGTLVIGQVGGADEGTYLCSFSNALGNGTGSIQLVVIGGCVEGGRECELMGGEGRENEGSVDICVDSECERLYSYSNCANVSLHNVYETSY